MTTEAYSETYMYPYPSQLAEEIRKGQAIAAWQEPGVEVKKLLEDTKGPIVELGGPTDYGHYYLDGIRLSESPVITNVAPDTLGGYDEEDRKKLTDQLDRLLDARQLDMPDNSAGMIIAAHLPLIDESDFDFANFSNEDALEYRRRQAIAEEAEADVAKGGDITPEVLSQSLRLKAASEVYRCLRPGGIYLADGNEVEKTAFEHIGFRTVALTSQKGQSSPYYYMVLQKH